MRDFAHAEQTAVMRVERDFTDELWGGWQPATLTFVIVFVEIIANLLYQQFARTRIGDVQDDGASRTGV